MCSVRAAALAWWSIDIYKTVMAAPAAWHEMVLPSFFYMISARKPRTHNMYGRAAFCYRILLYLVKLEASRGHFKAVFDVPRSSR